MPDSELPDAVLLDAVVDIARRAGREILDVYGTDFEATAKADASPLTQADLRAHRLIVAALTALQPSLPVLSEESAEIPFAERSGWRRYWLVDPLDGTKEFVSRNGEFTVNIALIDRHRPVLGVVHIPVVDTTYSGIPGLGAWREANDRGRLPIGVRRVARPPLRVVGSRSHGNPAMQQALDALGPHELKAAGSSIKLCMVADASADLYPRLGPTSEWDIAAGQAVIEAAGGQVVRLSDGIALAYNTKSGVLNPDFLAYGDPECFRRWPRG
ncbi:MAG TPA: 3'(2'),5'-bisphosphate nucleotidase CysQ [Steroidobacteraceae bacterium]|nr:3'(2'),5'-bisphosphate nucleotidase CysQ [Steroidobacteraceae bacterium]